MTSPYIFLGLFGCVITGHLGVKHIIYVRDVPASEATPLDKALVIADQYVLPGVEFALICQPVKAMTFAFAGLLDGGLYLVPGMSELRFPFAATLVRGSLVFATSIMKDITYASIDYFTPVHLHFNSSFVEDGFKEIPIVACKTHGARKLLCNLLGEFTKEAAHLVVHDDTNSTISWSKKPGKAIAKTTHQYLEDKVCVVFLGDQWGYVACGWMRSLFYEANNQIHTTDIRPQPDPIVRSLHPLGGTAWAAEEL